jgi:hypothetical protein
MNGREDLMPRGLMPREVTAAQLSAMKQRVQADPKLAAMFSSLNTFLQASEYEVIEMMVHANIWSGPAPKNPGGSGSVEFGLFDYWLNNPGTSWEWQLFVSFWKTLAGSLPVTQMNATNYQNLKNAVQPGQPGLVAADGSWFSESTYGGLDPATFHLTYPITIGMVEVVEDVPNDPASKRPSKPRDSDRRSGTGFSMQELRVWNPHWGQSRHTS